MTTIIPPVDKKLLIKELTSDKLLRPTNKANNHIYVVTAHEAPHVMDEIGRLREISFRESGGGTGRDKDVDEFDLMEVPYRQLIVWNQETQEIMGGYRFLHGKDALLDAKGQPILVTSHMFHFSETFIRDFLPKAVDVGRAFVQPAYQSSKMGAKSLFALDNLWDGLGAISISEKIDYLIGKVTIYPTFDAEARNLILYFMYRYFPDNDHLLNLKEEDYRPIEKIDQYDDFFSGMTFEENYRKLNLAVRKRGVNIPALISAYIGLSPTMRTFGTGINHEFASLFDTGIMITVADIFEHKRRRHIEPYLQYLAGLLRRNL